MGSLECTSPMSLPLFLLNSKPHLRVNVMQSDRNLSNLLPKCLIESVRGKGEQLHNIYLGSNAAAAALDF